MPISTAHPYFARIALGASIFLAAPARADVIEVEGSLQLWQRTCNGASCTLPVGIGAPVAFREDVRRPAAGAVSTVSTRAQSGPYTATVTVYWRADEGEDRHYLSTQTRITRGNDILAECSRFDLDDVTRYFPVGACSGLDFAAGLLIGASVAKRP